MRVLLKFDIDCDVDAAWRALHSPTTIAELYGPILTLEPLTPQPTSFASGDDIAVRMRLAGFAVGSQLISATDRELIHRGERVRIFRDSGVPLTGPLATLDVWDHQMAVSAVPGNPSKTLWRDRLTIGGKTAPLLWPGLFAAWQWRQLRIQQLARTWA